MTIEFAWLWALAVLPLPFIVARVWPRATPRQEPALKLPFDGALAATGSPTRTSPNRLRLVLATLAWVLLVIAAARPQHVGEPLQLPVSGRDLMLAVDISGSMEAEDMTISGHVVSRLTAVKAVAGDFIDHRKGDRLGLILFGDQAYLQTPLTFDRETVRTQLDEAAIGLAGKRTAIGDAIGLAVKRLRDQPQENRVLVLLTDGDNTAGEVAPLKAAELASREQVRIYTIGMGADQMVVQGIFGRQRVANTELDEGTLKAVAEATGGRYFRARDVKELQQIYHLLDSIEPVSEDQQTFRPVAELYRWPLGFAMFIVLLIALTHVPGLQGLPAREVHHA
ncbi:MAG: VWA domain-containing protein [Gammaproteobacteria bacterium]